MDEILDSPPEYVLESKCPGFKEPKSWHYIEGIGGYSSNISNKSKQ